RGAVEHWKRASPQLVRRRRVDMHAADVLQRGRIVGHRRDRAVRHTLRLHEIGAWYVDETPAIVIGFADVWAAGTDQGDTVQVEVVSIGARIERPDRHRPHASSVFVIGSPCTLRGMSVPMSRTSSARGEKMRKTTRRSESTSGDT